MPRHTYILPADITAPDWSCRGGVSSLSGEDCDYVLEIGKMQRCDTTMLALAAHIDEIRALFVMLKDDPLAVLIKRSWDKLTQELDDQLKELSASPEKVEEAIKELKEISGISS